MGVMQQVMYLATSLASFPWSALHSQTDLFLKTSYNTICLQGHAPDSERIERRIEQEDSLPGG